MAGTYPKNSPILGLLVLLLLSTLACERQSSSYDPIVATLGNFEVRLSEFNLEYLKFLQQPRTYDSPANRERFLQTFLQQRIFAAEARAMHLDTSKSINRRLESYRRQLLREAHYKYFIEQHLAVSDTLLREIYAYRREKRKIAHLFAQDSASAAELFAALRNGSSWSRLAAACFANGAAGPAEGLLGWVEWDQLDYDLAMAAFRTPAGRYSRPVRSRFGYHIIKVLDFKKPVFLTEYDFQLHRVRTREIVTRRLGERAAQAYIQKIMRQVSVQGNPQRLAFVYRRLRHVQDMAALPDSLQRGEAPEIESMGKDLWELAGEVIATCDGRAVTVEDVLLNYPYLPREACLDAKTMLGYVVRNELLVREALQRGLDNDPGLRKNLRLCEEYLLAHAYRKRLVQSLVVPEDELRSYYEQHREQRYRVIANDGTYRYAPYDSLRRRLYRELHASKRARIAEDAFHRLTRGMALKTHPEIIHQFYDKIKHGRTKNRDVLQSLLTQN